MTGNIQESFSFDEDKVPSRVYNVANEKVSIRTFDIVTQPKHSQCLFYR